MTPVQAQLFLLSNGANETHTDGCRNLDVRATASRPPRPDPPLIRPLPLLAFPLVSSRPLPALPPLPLRGHRQAS